MFVRQRFLFTHCFHLFCNRMNHNENDFLSNIPYDPTYEKLKPIDIQGTTFFVDEFNFVQVFTDGACLKNGQANASAGMGVYFGPNHVSNISKALTGYQSNNRAELLAVFEAIVIAIKHKIQKLCINTDSVYVIKSLTEWRHNWRKNNWINARGHEVANKLEFETLEKIFETTTRMIRCYRYVPGHENVAGNIQADLLARAGAAQNIQNMFDT